MARFRCRCGRYMRFDRFEPSIRFLGSGCGATYRYVCTKCGARGAVWAEPGNDEMPASAAIWGEGWEEDVWWDDNVGEWRIEKLIRP
jgi:hypothetical protein